MKWLWKVSEFSGFVVIVTQPCFCIIPHTAVAHCLLYWRQIRSGWLLKINQTNFCSRKTKSRINLIACLQVSCFAHKNVFYVPSHSPSSTHAYSWRLLCLKVMLMILQWHVNKQIFYCWYKTYLFKVVFFKNLPSHIQLLVSSVHFTRC